MSSAKSLGSMPAFSCCCRSIPDFCSFSIESGSYISSLYRIPYVSKAYVGEMDGILDTEVKVKLPCRCFLGVVPFLVCECNPNLDNLEKVDITSHSLIVVV